VVSVSRFAARPVGAHSKHFTPLARRIIRIEFTSVVLPTPGPPVMTTTRFTTIAIERIRKQFESQKFTVAGHTFGVTASFGIASFRGTDSPSFSDLVTHADAALYEFAVE
jgi:GGDEF domain-containing protein